MARQVTVVCAPARPAPWLDRWLADVAEPLGGGRYRIALSQAELARREGISPGTVQERIRRLDAAGHIVSRNPLVIRTDATPTDRAAEPRGDGDRNARCGEAITAMVRFIDAYGVTPALKAALGEMVAALEPALPAAGDRRAVPRLRGVPAAAPRPGQEDGEEISIQSPLLLAVPDHRAGATTEPRDAAAGRGSAAGERTAWDEAVGRLSEACRQRRLPDRPHNPEALWRVAAAVTAAQRSAAIDRITLQVRSGDPVKDPFGLLYRVIEQRQPDYLGPCRRVDPPAAETEQVPSAGAVDATGPPEPESPVEAECAARRAEDIAAREAAERLEAEALAVSAALDDATLAAVVAAIRPGMSGPLAASAMAVARAVVCWCRLAAIAHGRDFADAVVAGLRSGLTVGEGTAPPPLVLPAPAAGTPILRARIAALLSPVEDV